MARKVKFGAVLAKKVNAAAISTMHGMVRMLKSYCSQATISCFWKTRTTTALLVRVDMSYFVHNGTCA